MFVCRLCGLRNEQDSARCVSCGGVQARKKEALAIDERVKSREAVLRQKEVASKIREIWLSFLIFGVSLLVFALGVEGSPDWEEARAPASVIGLWFCFFGLMYALTERMVFAYLGGVGWAVLVLISACHSFLSFVKMMPARVLHSRRSIKTIRNLFFLFLVLPFIPLYRIYETSRFLAVYNSEIQD
jgi:hypothetical protein